MSLIPGAVGTATQFVDGVTTNSFVAPTVQKFTSGSGTYNLPSSPRAPVYIRVRMVGGGGGGMGQSLTSGDVSAGTAGGNTTFGTSLLVANGGAFAPAGTSNGQQGGAGGTASLGSGPIGLALQGGSGAPGSLGSSGVSVGASGGNGGATPFGGNGGGTFASTGGAGITNSGSGGGGGGDTTQTGNVGGGGGGAGGYVDAIINSPASTYSYAVGAAGTGGTSEGGGNGGAGGSGVIIVEEYYQ